MERGECPCAVLDILISRFRKLPVFVVYDFACGLFRSAQHTLWWAIKDTTIVSDRFHVGNHKCHRGFHPDSYEDLNGRNTVIHEQRNIPIARMKETLRNCSQTLYTSLLAYHTMYRKLQAIIRKEIDATVPRETSINAISLRGRSRSEQNSGHDTSTGESLPPRADDVQVWYFGKLKFKAPCCFDT